MKYLHTDLTADQANLIRKIAGQKRGSLDLKPEDQARFQSLFEEMVDRRGRLSLSYPGEWAGDDRPGILHDMSILVVK